MEELLKLLDPELQDKKRGQVDKMNNTQLDEDATNKLASLTKKAEDEVEKLAAQSPKPKTGCLLLHVYLACFSGSLIDSNCKQMLSGSIPVPKRCHNHQVEARFRWELLTL